MLTDFPLSQLDGLFIGGLRPPNPHSQSAFGLPLLRQYFCFPTTSFPIHVSHAGSTPMGGGIPSESCLLFGLPPHGRPSAFCLLQKDGGEGFATKTAPARQRSHLGPTFTKTNHHCLGV